MGPNQTVSSKVQDTLASATQQAKNLDEQKGISKTFYDVRSLLYYPRRTDLTLCLYSIWQRH